MDEMLVGFSSVYHTGRSFQKLWSHKNSMPQNATAHFQSQVISPDKLVFFVLSGQRWRTSDRIFTTQEGSYNRVHRKKIEIRFRQIIW